MRNAGRDCQKFIIHSSAIEPLGKSEGGKEPPLRSIKQFFKFFKFEKLGRQRGEKTFSTRWPGAPQKCGAPGVCYLETEQWIQSSFAGLGEMFCQLWTSEPR